MTTILVVDDEADLEYILRRRFRSQIQQGIYQFRFVQNGRDALTLLQNESTIDLVLLDINMPDLDGLSLLEQLPALNPILQVVMVSAYGDMVNIRQAMNKGAFDFVGKPIDMPDLELTIQKTCQHIQRLREARQLKLIDEVKTRFYDNITHEFRTPLTLILTPLQPLLTEFAHLPRLHQTLTTIDRNARQLLRQINQLLELAKLESGQFRVAPAVADLGDYVHRILTDCRPLADARQLTLTYTNELPGYYEFDPYLIESIVYNLLTNALKFTRQGSITVRLWCARPGTPDWVRLSVQDTGIGIDADKLPYIFNRFYQVHQPADSAPVSLSRTGTGIGLALVQEIMQLLNGTLDVASTVCTDGARSAGTLFTLELPLSTRSGPAHVLPAPDMGLTAYAAGPGGEPSAHEPVPAGPPDDRPLVLLVDDNAALLQLLAERLGVDYRLLTASDGAQAWELVQQELPEIVISDLMMPLMDGFELTRRIKNTPATDHIAVVLLTAKMSQPDRLDGLHQGADDYIGKPFHLDELQLRIANQLAYRHKLRCYYQQQLSQPSDPATAGPAMDPFLVRLYALIDEHLDGPLSVEMVADRLAMSRKTLYRKVQSLTQLAPNELIRMYRLRRGADLLTSGQAVSQVAYQVGFETPSYFAQAFRELYGQTPSEFAGSRSRSA